MINIPLSCNVESKRCQAGLTQQRAGELSGLTSRRWSAIESGRCRPRRSEIRKMERVLGGLQGSLKPYRALQLLTGSGRCCEVTRSPHLPQPSKPSHVCFQAAGKRSPEIVARLASRVAGRNDFALCDYLCDLVTLGSGSEAFFVLHLLANGAEPALAAPAEMGRATPYPIIEPALCRPVGDCLSPCLVAGGDFYFFGVCFATPEVVRVNILRWHSKGCCWRIVEIEESDSSEGNSSEFFTRLPVHRIRTAELEVLDLDFALLTNLAF